MDDPATAPNGEGIYEFGVFRFEAKSGLLSDEEAEQFLPKRAAGVLAELLRHPNDVVTKDELLASVWPSTNVSEQSLSEAVWYLRRALSDSAHSPTYIQTIRGRGFRFVADLKQQSAREESRFAEIMPVSPSFDRFGKSLAWRRGASFLPRVLQLAVLSAFATSVVLWPFYDQRLLDGDKASTVETNPGNGLQEGMTLWADLATVDPPPITQYLTFRFSTAAVSGDLSWDKRLHQSAEALYTGDYKTARETLAEMRAVRPDDRELAAYLGIALYLGGDRSDLVETLLIQGTQVTASHLRPVGHLATWYLANHYLRISEVEESVRNLLVLSRVPTTLGRASAALLSRISAEAQADETRSSELRPSTGEDDLEAMAA